jgi:hypothetical protein
MSAKTFFSKSLTFREIEAGAFLYPSVVKYTVWPDEIFCGIKAPIFISRTDLNSSHNLCLPALIKASILI